MAAKKIVVVDDDKNIRKTFNLLLGKKYKVFSAKDSKEALARLRTSPADLVIADYKLPGMNGLELIKKLRESGFEGGAMLISAHPDLVPVEDMSRFAISHFFVKPLDLGALNVSIDRVLQSEESAGSAA